MIGVFSNRGRMARSSAELERWSHAVLRNHELVKVNLFQAKMKEVTRQMMATVSELSMYQATAMKLSEECELLRDASAIARERLSENRPPTEAAEDEFRRVLRVEAMREQDERNRVARREEEEILNSNATRTTAEPRVNAYIPDGEFGLPTAYGKNAPFMPSQRGTTMRHTRRPNPKPVEI